MAERNTGRLAILLALIALIPAFGAWLFPALTKNDSEIVSVKRSNPSSALIELSLSPTMYALTSGADIFANDTRVLSGHRSNFIFGIDPGQVNIFIRSGNYQSNVLSFETHADRSTKIDCFSVDQLDKKLFCDLRERSVLSKIEVSRKEQFYGSLSDVFIFLDGQKVARLNNGQSKIVYTEARDRNLQAVSAKIGLLLKPETTGSALSLHIAPGELVRVECNYKMGIWASGVVECNLSN